MDSSPLITCIIPTCDRPSLLRRSLDSVFEQTYDNIEIIIVASPPHEPTRQIVSNYETKDQRIKPFYISDKSGPGAARNKGIRKASGKYIAFLDDDDVWRPEKLEIQVPYLDNYSIVSCLASIRTEDGLNEVKKPDLLVNEVDFNILFINTTTIYPSGSVFRTQELKDIGGFDEEFENVGIWDLALRIIDTYDSAFVLNQDLVIFDRMNDPGRLSQQSEVYEDLFKTYHRHKDKTQSDFARKRYVELGLGGYKETEGPVRYKYLFLGLRKDYELTIIRHLLDSIFS